jgi:type II secretory pathway pseudopilin PulG
MLIAGIVAICIVLLVLAFLLPRLSRHPQRGVDSALSVGQRGAGSAPGKLGRWLQKPFQTSRRAANRSAAAGRQGRGKLPF